MLKSPTRDISTLMKAKSMQKVSQPALENVSTLLVLVTKWKELGLMANHTDEVRIFNLNNFFSLVAYTQTSGHIEISEFKKGYKHGK